MNAQELSRPDGQQSSVWHCGKCGSVFGGRDNPAIGQTLAEACCRPKICECGAEVARYRTACQACLDRHQREKTAAQMVAAEKLDTWDGWVYWEGRGWKDGYFDSLEELHEWYDDQDEEFRPELPLWVFVCKKVPFDGLDVSRLIEMCTEDSFEDAAGRLSGIPELTTAIEAFNKANVGLVSYTPDFKYAVATN